MLTEIKNKIYLVLWSFIEDFNEGLQFESVHRCSDQSFLQDIWLDSGDILAKQQLRKYSLNNIFSLYSMEPSIYL